MKKFITILSAGLLALTAVSCLKEEKAVFDASKATAPVLGTYNVGEEVITAAYTPAVIEMGFNEKMAQNHTLAIVAWNDNTASKTLSTSNQDNVLTLKTVNLAKALITLGATEGSTVSVELAVRASLQDAARDNGINGYIDSEGHIKIASFAVVIPEQVGSPYEEYTEASTWTVIGKLTAYETINNWNGDLNMWATKDGKKHVAAHVALNAGDELKFRKDLAWDVNMGGTLGTLGDEFPVEQNGANIAITKNGVYDLFLDETAGTAIVAEAYDPYPEYTQSTNWTVIGKIPAHEIDWNGDIAMVSDGKTSIAFGVTLGADDEFKFRQDKSWDVNLGGEFGGLDNDFAVEQNGANIKVGTAGVYDLFVTPDAGTAKVTAACGLKISSIVGGDEPIEEEDKPEAWSIIGTINGDSWSTDIDLANVEGDKWVARSVTVTASDEFKIRADHGWDLSYGGPEANSQSTIDPGNAYEVYKPVLGTAFAAGDKNIQIGVAGTYDITLNYSKDGSTILIEEHKAAYALIGKINGDEWSKDFIMTEKDGIWTSPVVNITGGFKIRYDYSWDDANVYGAPAADFVPTVGTAFEAAQPGNDIKLAEAGDYKVVFNPTTKEITINAVAFPEQLYMIGNDFGNWDWNSEGVVEMIPVINNQWGGDATAQFYTIQYLTTGSQFKFCAQRAWSGDFWGLDTNDGFVEAGGNCTVEADGTYLIHVDLKRSMVHVEPARVYGIGDCFGGWNEAMEGALFAADGKTLKATATGNGNVRAYVASAISTSSWWTREFGIIDGKIVYRTGEELAWPAGYAGNTVTLDFSNGTASITGEVVEVPWSLIGFHSQDESWSTDFELSAVEGHDGWLVVKNIGSAGSGDDINITFKFRKGGWSTQFGAAEAGPHEAGKIIALSGADGNKDIKIMGEATWDVYLNPDEAKAFVLAAGTDFAVPAE